MRGLIIFIYSVISCYIMYYIEQEIGISYLPKSAIKIISFVIIPIFLIMKVKREKIFDYLHLKGLKIRNLNSGFLIGIMGALAIISLGFTLSGYIDFDSLRLELAEKLNITKNIFILVALYITFVNSFIEEFFFRGFVYLNMENSIAKIPRMIFSGVLFGMYHMGIFLTWFDSWLIMLCVLALSLVGILLCYINGKTKNFLNSWLIHIIGDGAILTYGYFMMYM